MKQVNVSWYSYSVWIILWLLDLLWLNNLNYIVSVDAWINVDMKESTIQFPRLNYDLRSYSFTVISYQLQIIYNLLLAQHLLIALAGAQVWFCLCL